MRTDTVTQQTPHKKQNLTLKTVGEAKPDQYSQSNPIGVFKPDQKVKKSKA
jgi:hypothetical protein